MDYIVNYEGRYVVPLKRDLRFTSICGLVYKGCGVFESGKIL
jgi:hypothetical protein